MDPASGMDRSGEPTSRPSADDSGQTRPGLPQQRYPTRPSSRAAPQGSSTTTIRLLVVIGLGAGAGWVIATLLWPFLPGIVTSAVLATLFFPAQRELRRHLRHPSIAAFAGTTIVFFLVLLPLAALSIVLAGEIASGLQWVGRAAAGALAPEGAIMSWFHAVAQRVGMDAPAAQATLGAQVEQLAGTLAGRTLGLLTGIGGILLQAGIALFTLYYLLRDGDHVVGAIKWLFPLRADDTDYLVNRALEVTYATVYGNVVVAIVQGGLGGLAFWVLGLPGAVLWGTVMGVLSLLPAIGAFLVWLPAGAYLLLSGELLKGIVLLAFGALVISTVDNLLRAILVSGRAQLHPLIVFFSVLGGLVVFGPAGIFIGPVIFVLCLALVEMARLAIEPDAAARHALQTSMALTYGPVEAPRQRAPWRWPRTRRRRGAERGGLTRGAREHGDS